ncbi:MAG: divalent-cation tolerance protein CutA [Burkholderiales bacterium]|nr:divalent-cation tolerance protein CutA [Burkholderiales bacterium]
MSDAVILVLTSMPDRDAAMELARKLLAGRLAACVTIGAPVDSMYHWRGQIETAREVVVVVKTREKCYPRVEVAIAAAHPYEIPEIVAVPVMHGFAPYLEWITGETLSP